MVIVDNIQKIAPTIAQAVIINCGTKWVTTLALMSALEMANMPLLLIDCESQDDSRAHFEQLAKTHCLQFQWLDWPMRSHPDALNHLFSAIPAELVLLIDSDIEIRSQQVVAAMRCALAREVCAYGAGFLQGAEWLEPPLHRLPKATGYYAERMWIPLTLLRVAAVRAAFDDGVRFFAHRPFFEVPGMPRLSKLIGSRFRVPMLRNLKMPRIGHIEFDSRVPQGARPAFVDYDTGADLHHHLVTHGRPFVKVADHLWGDVHHYHGVTRSKIANPFRPVAAQFGMVSKHAETAHGFAENDARKQLLERFGIS